MIRVHMILAFSSGILCGVLLLVAFLKRRFSESPIFFWLVGWYFATYLAHCTIVLLNASEAAWLWCSLITTQIGFVLEITVLYELARVLIFSHSTLAKRWSSFPGNILAFLVLVSTLLAALSPAVSKMMLNRVLQTTCKTESCTELGLLLVLLCVTHILGMSWTRFHAGIALGWGLSSSVNIIAMVLVSRMGPSSLLPMDALGYAGFDGCVLIWLRYVLLSDQRDSGTVPVLHQMLLTTQETNALQTILGGES